MMILEALMVFSIWLGGVYYIVRLIRKYRKEESKGEA